MEKQQHIVDSFLKNVDTGLSMFRNFKIATDKAKSKSWTSATLVAVIAGIGDIYQKGVPRDNV